MDKAMRIQEPILCGKNEDLIVTWSEVLQPMTGKMLLGKLEGLPEKVRSIKMHSFSSSCAFLAAAGN